MSKPNVSHYSYRKDNVLPSANDVPTSRRTAFCLRVREGAAGVCPPPPAVPGALGRARSPGEDGASGTPQLQAEGYGRLQGKEGPRSVESCFPGGNHNGICQKGGGRETAWAALCLNPPSRDHGTDQPMASSASMHPAPCTAQRPESGSVGSALPSRGSQHTVSTREVLPHSLETPWNEPR